MQRPDLSRLRPPSQAPFPTLPPLGYRDEKGEESGVLRSQVDFLAAHMQKQRTEHEEALLQTNRVFGELLVSMETVAEYFRESLGARHIPTGQVAFTCDADRSVGILNLLWHSISFTVRGNTKPLALHRPGREPLFSGRIVALNGDFLDPAAGLLYQPFPDILQHEIASLYLPADPMAPAVMKIRHLGAEELFFHQVDAARGFLMKTVEVVCGGGFFHES